MIRGMSKFQEHFADFGDQYVLIGGAASDLIDRQIQTTQ